jgi:transcriptional regulator with XRE-family HTH domain
MPKSILRITLGREIKRLRSERGLSQAALAAASGVRQATISEIEQESGNPTLDTIDSLCKALKVTPQLRLVSAVAAKQ